MSKVGKNMATMYVLSETSKVWLLRTVLAGTVGQVEVVIHPYIPDSYCFLLEKSLI